jgi:hypothetical protein
LPNLLLLDVEKEATQLKQSGLPRKESASAVEWRWNQVFQGWIMQFLNELHKKIVVLIFKVFNPQLPPPHTHTNFANTESLPFYRTLRASALIVPCSEESSTSCIKRLDRCLRKEMCKHEIDRQPAEDNVNQHELTARVEHLCFTPGQIPIKIVEEGPKVGDAKFERGHGQTKVGLGEDGGLPPKRGRLDLLLSWVDMYRTKVDL